MKAAIGTILMIAGGGVILVAIYLAMQELVGLYGGALSDPLNQPEGSEKAASDKMFQAVVIGAIGAPFFLVGSVLVKAALFKKVKNAMHASQGRDKERVARG